MDVSESVVEKKKRRLLKTSDKTPSTESPAELSTESTTPTDVNAKMQDTKQPKSSAAVAPIKTLFHYEESEVANRDPRKDLELHKSVCNEVRNAMAFIQQAKSSGDASQEQAIEEMTVHGTLQFVSLKKLNRIGHFRSKKMRDATGEAKQKVDQQHLKLQNLLYEVMHLQKEIGKCLQFCSKDEEIELIGVDQFYAEAPPEISKPDATRGDTHQLTLARLDWELEQRKCLSVALTEAQRRKDEMATEIVDKKAYLESLGPMLNTILQSTKPVQEHLDMPFDKVLEQHRVAADLPAPLYVLFIQATAYGEACDKHINVAIQGDAELARTEEARSVDAEDESDNNSEGEEHEKGEAGKRRHRRSVGDARISRKRERILRKHPLSVVVTIKCRNGCTLCLTFHYLVTLGIVTVTVRFDVTGQQSPATAAASISGGDLLKPDTFLSCLFPDDNGEDTPNPANRFALSAAGMGDFGGYVTQIGRAYLWAQRLCGLQFPPAMISEKPPQVISAAHMKETVTRLRRRITVRLSLQKQLASLEQCSVPVREQFPTKISSRLAKWARTTREDFEGYAYTRGIVALGLSSASCLYFSGTLERGSASLVFQVVVSPDYPRSVPVFALLVRWKTDRTAMTDENVRDMEANVNVHSMPEDVGEGDVMLLTNQIQCLLVCFDVYLETELESGVTEGPTEFAKEKICPRLTRGPDRAKPYVYNPLGFFSQRTESGYVA